MKKRIAKLFAIILCVTLLGAVFAGCNGGEKDPNAPEKEFWMPYIEKK